MLSGDIEQNPGPDKSSLEQAMERMESKLNETISGLEAKISRVLEVVEKQAETLDKKINDIQNTLQASTTQIHGDIQGLRETMNEHTRTISALTDDNQKTVETVARLEDELERIERQSRRNNVRVFGIPETEGGESYGECADKLFELLEKYFPEKEWSKEDVERAHRLGPRKPNSSFPRPMIVRFQKWGDVMSVMQNHGAREKMKTDGLKLTSDLTRRQAAQLKAVREEGKVGYFVRGELHVKDRPNTLETGGGGGRTRETVTQSGSEGGRRESVTQSGAEGGRRESVTQSGSEKEQPRRSLSQGQQPEKPRTRSDTSSTNQSTIPNAWHKSRPSGRPSYDRSARATQSWK